MKYFINPMLIFLMLVSSTTAHEENKVVVVPLGDDAPFISLQDALTELDPGATFAAREQLISRCNATQDARLETCTGQACIDATHAKALCDQLPSGLSDAEIALGVLPCNGVVPVQQCGGANPNCPLGADLDGDGKNDTCVSGQRCIPASEGAKCDAGVLYDCYLNTTYYAAVRGCDCNCE